MIRIGKKLLPFSHKPGCRMLIPGTSFVVRAFPALIRIETLEGEIIKERAYSVTPPLKQFTCRQDLERGCVTVYSESYCVHIKPDLTITQTKHPHLPPLSSQENLSFGSHKQQDFEMIRRRGDLKEILPIWFRLGSLLKLPPLETLPKEGMCSLVNRCEEAILSKKPERIAPAFYLLFLAGFEELMLPCLKDTGYQGILHDSSPIPKLSPLYLLTEGARLIRSLFVQQQGEAISLLPALPPEFFAGRMCGVQCPPWGSLDFEWSKKQLRQVHFFARTSGKLRFLFPSDLHSFRFRQQKENKEIRVLSGNFLEIKASTHYLLDQFRK